MAKRNNRLDTDLDALASMSSAQLQEHWSTIGADAPPSIPTPLLRRLLAQRLQERRQGPLSVLATRELERVASNTSTSAPIAQRPALSPGTRLIREWNGQTIAVEVVEGGFRQDGRMYRSLTEIAREITGAHWSGPRFFGLTRHG